jgi:Mn-dependent DtxR family transcriptional regulator
MENSEDPLAQFGLDAIDLRWTLKDIAAQRSWMINEDHVSKLIKLGLVEMRDDKPFLTIAGRTRHGMVDIRNSRLVERGLKATK